MTDSGNITNVENCGTIIIVEIKTAEGQIRPIYFDHSAFRWLLEGEGCGAADLIGRKASYDGETLRFLDGE